MKKRIRFFVDGEPVGKGRPRFVKSGRTFTPKKTADYEDLVRAKYRAVANDFMFDDVALGVRITAFYGVPKSVSQRKKEKMLGTRVTKRPDADNISKACLDALNGVAYRDDSLVAELEVLKLYADRGCVMVEIEEL